MLENLFLILLVVLGISLLIFIHEFGHYICARMAGVRVLLRQAHLGLPARRHGLPPVSSADRRLRPGGG